MKNEFINTINVNKFMKICQELEDPSSLIGPSLGMVTGPAGRGKSEAAKHYAVHSNAIYIPPLNTRTSPMLLREISFELGKIRPMRSESCLAIIGEEMSKERRLIIVDEADLLPMPILEMLRNLNERYACPVLFIGEDELKGKIESRRRLSSRIRRRMEFSPVSQQDIAFFFKRCMEMSLQADVTATIQKHCRGDWRPVLTVAIGIERAMKASGSPEVTAEMVKDVIGNA
jgi:DNA transposition AAA+ family ATPase